MCLQLSFELLHAFYKNLKKEVIKIIFLVIIFSEISFDIYKRVAKRGNTNAINVTSIGMLIGCMKYSWAKKNVTLSSMILC